MLTDTRDDSASLIEIVTLDCSVFCPLSAGYLCHPKAWPSQPDCGVWLPFRRKTKGHGVAILGIVQVWGGLGRNIYKELESDIEGFVAPSGGDLRKWCEEVLFT